MIAGHRGWNRQPEGTSFASGSSSDGVSTLVETAWGSSDGTEEMSICV
jgi:hypothetical protein